MKIAAATVEKAREGKLKVSEIYSGTTRYGNSTTTINARIHQNTPGRPQEPENVKRHRELCDGLNRLYAAKNADYGDSFHKSYEEWGPLMAAIRLGEKYNRFCRLIRNEANVKDESIRDTLIDLANYSLMTVLELDKEEQNK